MIEPKTEYDSPWKDILEIYFEDFISFFFSYLHGEIDWTKNIEFLDKELRQVTRDATIGKRLVDALVKVYRINGEEYWLYIHIEVQNQPDSEFGERMYIYHYKIYDKFKCPIESLAILGDDDMNWRPDHFMIRGIRTTSRFDFSIVKLLDYLQRWSELEVSHNPFATVVMVHLRTLETTSNREKRKEYKLALIKRLYKQGFSRQDIINLYGLIDWMMTLPDELQKEFNQEITQYEQEMNMRYVTSIERLGEERGEQRGELKGIQKVLLRQLNHRLGEIQPALIEQVHQLSVEKSEELSVALMDFSAVADLEQWLQNHIQQ